MMMSRERLARETARANEAERRAVDAERQAAEVMSLFKSTHEAKLVLERDLHKAREELGLYKVQLETAQKGTHCRDSVSVETHDRAQRSFVHRKL